MKKRYLALISVAVFALFISACTPMMAQMDGQAADRVVTDMVPGNGKTGIRGIVVMRDTGAPIEGAFVNLYPNAISNLLGPSQFLAGPTGPDGAFSSAAPEGAYFVVARKRQSGVSTGPLGPGDYYSEHQRILAKVKEGNITVVTLPVIPMKAPMFFKKEVVDRQTTTGIKGKLISADGSPLPGGFAMAYTDTELKRLPDYASTLSDSNGDYTIYLPEGGTFYLAGRIHAWDMPKPGEPYGILGGDTPESIVVKDGAFLEGIDIEMKPFDGVYHPGMGKRPF